MFSEENILVILFSIPVYQLMFFTVQSVSFKLRRDRARVMLGLLMLAMTLVLIANIVFYFKYYETFSTLYYLFIPLILTILPFYYIYVQILIEGVRSINVRSLIVLLLPAAFILLLNFMTWGPLTPEEKRQFLVLGFRGPEGANPAIRFVEQVFWLGNVGLLGAQVVISMIRSVRILQRASRINDADPSRLPYLKMNWMVLVFSSVMIFVILMSLMNILTPEKLIILVAYNVLVLITGGITGYYGLRQDQLEKEVSVVHSPDTPEITSRNGKKGEEQPVMTTEQKLRMQRLDEIMKSEKLFLDDGLTITTLAAKMGISKRELSSLINNSRNQNFYGLINEYRVIESIAMLKDDNYRHLTIEAISEKAGFRSKSSFNACFKKYTGLTPRQYREQYD